MEADVEKIKSGCNFAFGAVWGISALYVVLKSILVCLCYVLPSVTAEAVVSLVGSPLEGIVTPYFARVATIMHIPFVVK
jgi:hypothetical protein